MTARLEDAPPRVAVEDGKTVRGWVLYRLGRWIECYSLPAGPATVPFYTVVAINVFDVLTALEIELSV